MGDAMKSVTVDPMFASQIEIDRISGSPGRDRAVESRIEDCDHRNARSHHSARTLDPRDACRVMQRRQFGQAIDRGQDLPVDSDRLVKLFASMHHSMSDRLDAEGPPFLQARLLQQLHHALNCLGVGDNRLCGLTDPCAGTRERQSGIEPDLFD